MTEDLADTILGFIVCIGIFVVILIIYGFAYSNGEDIVIIGNNRLRNLENE